MYLIPLGGSHRMRKLCEVNESGSKTTLPGRRGTVRYCAVVGVEIWSSLTVSTEILYARPGIKLLKAACAGPGGSPSLATSIMLSIAS